MINPINLRPFKKFCVTIGNLPTTYIESLSYYEMLEWLCNYIDKTVIPAINTEGEAIEELQNAFTTLKNYVDNYFENLDVQEEINNKLDEMAESGELTELLTTYLQLKTIYSFNSISELVASENFIDGSFAKTSGFYSNNDGGAANYKIRTILNTDVIDNIHLFAITNDDTLVAELNEIDNINVKQLGAKNDIDNTNIIQYALNNFNNIQIDETYSITNTLTINNKNNLNIFGNGGLTINHTLNHDLITLNTCNNITFKDITLSNDQKHVDDDAPTNVYIMYVTNGENILFDNVKIINAYQKGVDFISSGYLTFKNCNFKDCYYNMLTFLTECHDILVENCVFDTTGCTYQNAYLISTGSEDYSTTVAYMCKNITIRDCEFYHNAIWEGIDSHGCENLTIENNYIEDCAYGIAISYDTRTPVTNMLGDNIYIRNNKVVNKTLLSTEIGIYVSGSENRYIKNVIIEDNYVENYNTANKYSIYLVRAKNYSINNNKINKFYNVGIGFTYTYTGFVKNNIIEYNDALSTQAMGIRYVTGNWLSHCQNNVMIGNCYTPLYIGVAMSGSRGITMLKDNLATNTSVKYNSWGSNNTILGVVSNTNTKRFGGKGIHSVDDNDIIKSYCTDNVLRGSGETLSDVSITSSSGTKTITIAQVVALYMCIGEEIVIPGAATGGTNLTTIITDVIDDYTFTIKDNIATAVSNVHPQNTSSTWSNV